MWKRLHVKYRLFLLEFNKIFPQHTFEKSSKFKIHQTASSESQASCGRTDGRSYRQTERQTDAWIDMTKLTVAFRNFVNAPKIIIKFSFFLKSLFKTPTTYPRFCRLVTRILPRRHGFDPSPIHLTFVVDKVSLAHVSLPLFQYSPVSIIPPLLHTHSFIYHTRCIMFLSQYFSFPLSVSFQHCSIERKSTRLHSSK